MSKHMNKLEAGFAESELVQKYPETEGYKIDTRKEAGTPESVFQTVHGESVEAFINAAIDRAKEKKEISSTEALKLRANMLRNISDEFKARGWGKRAIRRYKGRVIEGYETKKGKEVIISYLSGLAGLITKQRAAADFADIMKTISISPKAGKEQTQLFDYAARYARDMLRNDTQLERNFGKMRGAAFMWYLAGSPKAAFIQLRSHYRYGRKGWRYCIRFLGNVEIVSPLLLKYGP